MTTTNTPVPVNNNFGNNNATQRAQGLIIPNTEQSSGHSLTEYMSATLQAPTTVGTGTDNQQQRKNNPGNDNEDDDREEENWSQDLFYGTQNVENGHGCGNGIGNENGIGLNGIGSRKEIYNDKNNHGNQSGGSNEQKR